MIRQSGAEIATTYEIEEAVTEATPEVQGAA
jgi:hypothetical protein